MQQMLFDESFLRQLDQLALLSRRARRGQMQGERRSPKRGQSVEFADYRDYVPGDDLRTLDWNVYARLEKLFVKLFVEEEDATVHVLLDGSQSMDFGEPAKWQYALRLAGALGYIALAEMDRVAAAVLSNGASMRMQPLRGKRVALAWFDWLRAQRPGGEAHPGPALREYAGTARPAGPALVVSDLMDPTWEDGLLALSAARFEITVLHVLSPQEVNPNLDGDIKLVDSETGRAVEITADFDLLARYRENLAGWQERLRSFCARRDINYVFVETSLPVETLLLSFLRERAVIR
jgi:uncharacterized protein (DUF58 family)